MDGDLFFHSWRRSVVLVNRSEKTLNGAVADSGGGEEAGVPWRETILKFSGKSNLAFLKNVLLCPLRYHKITTVSFFPLVSLNAACRIAF